MSIRFVITGAALLALTACGGGGGGGGLSNGIVHATDDATVRSLTLSLFDAVDSSPGGGGAGLVDVTTIPNSTSVNYDGIIQVIQTGAPPTADGYYSPITLVANFGTPNIAGTADQFYRFAGDGGLPTGSGTAVGGSVDVSASLSGYSGEFNGVTISGAVDFDGNGSAEGSFSTTDASGKFIGPASNDPQYFLAFDSGVSVTGASISAVNISVAAEETP